MTKEVARALDGDLDRLRAHPYDPAAPFWRAAEEQHVDLLLLDLARHGGSAEAWPHAARLLARSATVDAAAIRALRDRELGRVLDLLAAAGARCLIIKGAALAHLLYRQPYLRRRSDADLLIRAEDADRAAVLLQGHGYARAPEVSGSYATSQMHLDRSAHPDHRDALDIHWRIVNAHAFADAVSFAEFDAARMPVPALGANAWTLCAPHALALACIHCVAHHPNSDDLLWLWDVRLLATAMTDSDGDTFCDVATRAAARAVCAHVLKAADARFSTPAAAALADRVRPPHGAADEPSARFLGAGLSQADILRSDLASLGWRRGVSLLREHLFPSASYMRTLYSGWPSVLLPVAYLHRILAGAPKWLRRP